MIQTYYFKITHNEEELLTTEAGALLMIQTMCPGRVGISTELKELSLSGNGEEVTMAPLTIKKMVVINE